MRAITDKAATVRRKAPLSEAAFGIAALLLCVLLVHGFYTLIVRPRAEASLIQAAAMAESHERQTSLRSIFVADPPPVGNAPDRAALAGCAARPRAARAAIHGVQ